MRFLNCGPNSMWLKVKVNKIIIRSFKKYDTTNAVIDSENNQINIQKNNKEWNEKQIFSRLIETE